AFDLKDALVPELHKAEADFIVINFANGDMVGHTGSMNAAIKACEVVDVCTRQVVEAAIANNYTILIIADHGNSETMFNSDGSPNTAPTTKPETLILIDSDIKEIHNGVLGDIAPTVLKLMGIPQPNVMTGNYLI